MDASPCTCPSSTAVREWTERLRHCVLNLQDLLQAGPAVEPRSRTCDRRLFDAHPNRGPPSPPPAAESATRAAIAAVAAVAAQPPPSAASCPASATRISIAGSPPEARSDVLSRGSGSDGSGSTVPTPSRRPRPQRAQYMLHTSTRRVRGTFSLPRTQARTKRLREAVAEEEEEEEKGNEDEDEGDEAGQAATRRVRRAPRAKRPRTRSSRTQEWRDDDTYLVVLVDTPGSPEPDAQQRLPRDMRERERTGDKVPFQLRNQRTGRIFRADPAQCLQRMPFREYSFYPVLAEDQAYRNDVVSADDAICTTTLTRRGFHIDAQADRIIHESLREGFPMWYARWARHYAAVASQDDLLSDCDDASWRADESDADTDTHEAGDARARQRDDSDDEEEEDITG